MEEPDLFDAGIWRRGAELGWTAMLVPEEHGGGSVTEQPLVDLVVLAEELGRALNPGPFVPTNVVADAIARFGSQAQRRSTCLALREGEATAAWCLSGDGSPEARGRRRARRARRATGGGSTECPATCTAAGTTALLLVVARDAATATSSTCSCPRPPPGLSTRTLSGLDLTRRFAEVRFDGVVVPGGDRSCAGGSGRGGLERCLAVATVLQAAESVGAAEVLFEETVEYLKKRVQFGRTIASFQAIKHRLADLQMELEAMRAAAEYAALALGRRVRGRRRRRWPPPGPTSTTPSPISAARRCSSTAGSGSPGSTTSTSSCGGPRSTRCSTATAPGTASGWSD